ncbi:P-loop containing nucleoside triphosphate hydrolase [Sesbania bispinosa]|nr:P-loop containing nucleoside triphosphate hydrolase [Sesbania bispinosa]
MCSPIDSYKWLPPSVQAWLKEQLIQLKLYETKVKELEDVITELMEAKDEVEQNVKEEEKRHGREISAKVKEWIEGVEKTISEYEDIVQYRELARFKLFKSGYLPKPGIRYHLSRKAYDITKKVKKLLETAKFSTFSHWLGPPSMTAFFYNVGYVPFQSRDETMENIRAALENPSVTMIGLHGWSGVGKTTLVKEIVKKALKDKMFDVVIMAEVTRNPDIRKIQGEIADILGMKLDEESDKARAARIGKRLKNEKEKTLVILDDLWAKLDFNLLGIFSQNDDVDDSQRNAEEEKSPNVEKEKHPTVKSEVPSASNRLKTEETLSRFKACKVLLISETKQVLLSQMEGQEKSIFSMQVLKEKESETLFKKMAGISDGNPEFEKLAAQIANKCDGFPMSIVTIARALKDQSRSVWENAYRKLEWQKLTGAPELSTRFSYNLLENKELKYTFLLCARMGRDALIMDLVRYCIGLGFLEGIYTVREARNRVYALVGRLKESGLLSNSYSSDHFTMQDNVRSAALYIASEEMDVLVMTKGKLDECPDKEKLEKYIAISIDHCDIIEWFPTSINCPRLKIFHVKNNDPCLEVPENLFEGMKELKVLILIGINLSPLPSSIRHLTKLRMICLENCKLGENLSIIGGLKKLRVLSLSGSDIKELPVELKYLTKLQIFDISNCSKLEKIQSPVISSLISVEELYMRNTSIQWNQSENASLSELRRLNQLTTLDIQIKDISYFPKNMFFDKLCNYSIVIGNLSAYFEKDFKMPEVLRFLAIQLKDNFVIHSLKGIKMLLDGVENLFLEELKGVDDLFYRLNLRGFPDLKQLLIVNNPNLQSLINPKDRQHPEKVFPKLESLSLHNLMDMEEICSCKLSAPSFGSLKVIKINLCSQLKHVFLFSVVCLLIVLETIEVSECNALEKIVPLHEVNGKSKLLEFPELRSLTLQTLPEFIGLYPTSSTGGENAELFDEKVAASKLERMVLSSIQIGKIWSDSLNSGFQNLIQLDVNDCCNLKYLISFSMAKSLENLQSLFVSECEQMIHIFSPGKSSHVEEGSIFPKLKNIKLSSMKRLSKIWNYELLPNSFGKLDTLIIEGCDKLINVFPRYMEGIFQNLCNLRVTDCRSMEAIFVLDHKKKDAKDVTNFQDVYLETLPKLKHIWKQNKDQGGVLINLTNLQKIWVHDCDSLKNIFPVSVARGLHNLEYLVVSDCFGLKEIVAKGKGTNNDTSSSLDPSFVFPKLTTIKFLALPNLESYFYPGANYELRCPVLNNLFIESCYKLGPFGKETADGQKPVLFPQEVINNLKSMQIDAESSSMGEGINYRMDNLEELCLFRLEKIEILYSFLHSNPKLVSLSLDHCPFEEIAPHKSPLEIENLGVVPKLKCLRLMDLLGLKNIGFERDIVLQRIESLILKGCPRLKTVVPSPVSLTSLDKSGSG